MLHFYAAKVFRREADVSFVPDLLQCWAKVHRQKRDTLERMSLCTLPS